MLRLIFIIFILLTSLGWLFFLVTQVPEYIPEMDFDHELIRFPRDLEELKILTNLISKMTRTNLGYYYVLVLFSSAYLFKQTFAIPGSVFLNLLAGAIFGLSFGFSLTCVLTACGATCCYLMAKFVGRNTALKYFPHRIHHFSSLIEENSKRLPYFLLSLRVLPISPNWAMNICCGVLDVPILTFFLTVLIGLMPYNYICVTTGVLVSKLTSISEIFTWTTMIQMTGIAIMAILPAFLVKQKKHQGLKLP